MNIRLAVIFAIALLTMSVTFSSVYAKGPPPPPPIAGKWTISFFMAGSGCTTPYSMFKQDGGSDPAKFSPPPAPTPSLVPIVPGGNKIDVKIGVTNALANTSYYYEVTSWFGPVFLFKTDSHGNGSTCITVTIKPNADSTSPNDCFTVPQKIGVGGDSPNDFDGNIIDHFWTGGGCTPTSVPEFPLGLPAMILVLIPAILLIRKRFAIS